MEPLKIIMGADEPKIYANGETGEISIEGKVLTFFEILTDEYFKPFSKWLIEFCNRNISDTLTVNLRFSYFNTSAEKVLIFPVLRLIEKHRSHFKQVAVNWFYPSDDDDMLDSGEIFQSLTELDFNLIPVMVDELA